MFSPSTFSRAVLVAGGLAVSLTALAQTSTPSTTPIQVSISGQPVNFTDGKPMVMNDQVLVPFRAVLEKMGSQVTYDASTKTVLASQAGHQVKLTIGSQQAQVDGRAITTSIPPMVQNGTTYIPLRFVSESLGGTAQYDAATKSVMIEPAKAEASGSTASAQEINAPTNAPSNEAATNMPSENAANAVNTPAMPDAGMNAPAVNAPDTNTANNAMTEAITPAVSTPPVRRTSPAPVENEVAAPNPLLAYWPWLVLFAVAGVAVAWLLTRRGAGRVIASDTQSSSDKK